ncbi:hypothetical protein [Herbiconiux daphne]|uniref:Uncharacterized protein n=1 Tax=Herbiconiux daphne TaxID=2970914 RepID=A0ABT2HBV8_9MICO|nr:hypothetical protein [Herbiconiux daphne]MCS5737430.1 hypothetical protein [Herbiconiux daphne]
MAFPGPGPGRPKGSKNRLSTSILVGLNKPEQIQKQWDRLIHIIEHGKDADALNAIKLIWAHTFDNDLPDELANDTATREQVNTLMEEVKKLAGLSNPFESQGLPEVQ